MDISLNNGRVRLPGMAVVTCTGTTARVVQYDGDDDEGSFHILADIALPLPVEAQSIDRGVLLRIVKARLGNPTAPADLGLTQDCYGTGAPPSVYPIARGQIARQTMGR